MFNKERGIRVLLMDDSVYDSMLFDMYEFKKYGFGNIIDPEYRSINYNDFKKFLMAVEWLLGRIDNGMDIIVNSESVDELVRESSAESAWDCKLLNAGRTGEVWTSIQDKRVISNAHETQIKLGEFVFSPKHCDIVINLQNGNVYTSLFNKYDFLDFNKELIHKSRECMEFRIFDTKDIINAIEEI